MGIFSNDKKACPICGNATPRLFPTKVEGLPLCKECAGKISMESSMMPKLTINELWTHLDYRKANADKFASFTDTEQHGVGRYAILHMDVEKKLFYIAEGRPSNPPVFEYAELVSFGLMEDGRTVAQCNAGGYELSSSAIETYVIPVKPLVKPRAAKPAATVTGASDAEAKPEAPDKPIDSLRLSITVNNPYWKVLNYNIALPELDSEDELRRWVSDYKALLSTALEACEALSRIMGVKTRQQIAAEVKEKAEAIEAIQSAQAAAKEAENAAKEAKNANEAASIEMLKKWKELLDMGAITQEEFEAKKRELLS